MFDCETCYNNSTTACSDCKAPYYKYVPVCDACKGPVCGGCGGHAVVVEEKGVERLMCFNDSEIICYGTYCGDAILRG